jgi:general secretion pathway protein K
MALNRRGFVLLAVLWALVAVSAVALLLESGGRGERRAVMNLQADLEARWAARGAVAEAVARLDSLTKVSIGGFALPMSGDTLFGAGSVQTGRAVAVAVVRDLRSRLNLNLASGAELERLARAAGLDSLAALQFADRVLDWRDPDGAPRPHGAEAAEYVAEEPPARAGDQPFADLRELERLHGLSHEQFARLSPYLTVSGDGLINPNGAEAPVLATLPGVDSATAEAIVAFRRKQTLGHPYALIALAGALAKDSILSHMEEFRGRLAFTPRDVEIVALGRAFGGIPVARVRALVRLEGGAAWRVVGVTEW